MAKRVFKIWRGAADGEFKTYEIEVEQGMVVLDCLHKIQADHAGDLAVRWNCKAGKCGSCSVEINGKPRLSCMTRLNMYEPDEEIRVQPLKSFPIVKDLVCDVSFNYRQNEKIKPFTPKPRDADGEYRMYQEDIDRVQEFRKCIECFLCQDVCHIIRDRDAQDKFAGPRLMIRAASLEMHPLDDADRVPEVRSDLGSGMCNITRCCTEVCPEHIGITDNGIIPLKERVVDRYYDPILIAGRKLFGIRKRTEVKKYRAPNAPKPKG